MPALSSFTTPLMRTAALLGLPLGRIDPAHVALAVEFGEIVEEGERLRRRSSRAEEIRRQISLLRPFRPQLDRRPLAGYSQDSNRFLLKPGLRARNCQTMLADGRTPRAKGASFNAPCSTLPTPPSAFHPPLQCHDAHNAEQAEQLRWKKFPVLDDGFVCLVDVMGDDRAVVQAARVSYGEGTQAGFRRPHADPLPDAAPAHDAVRDGRAEVPRPRADGLLAAVDSPPHGLGQRNSTRYSLAIDAAAADARRRAGAARPSRTARAARAAWSPRLGEELTAEEAALQQQCPRGLPAAAGPGRGPRAGPQGPAAFDLYRGLLEGRPAQPAAFSRTADGRITRNWKSAAMPRRWAARSSRRCCRCRGRRLSIIACTA